MTLRVGELVLIRMRFHHGAGAKVRPALIVLDTGDDDFVAAPVTSQSRHSAFDLAIQDWSFAGLNVASTIRLHKLTVIEKTEVVRILGNLAEQDRAAFLALLCRAFCPASKGR
jgi:mRNA interferase MazF